MELRTKAEINYLKYPENVEMKTDLENILKIRHWEGETSKIVQNSDVITSHTHKASFEIRNLHNFFWGNTEHVFIHFFVFTIIKM